MRVQDILQRSQYLRMDGGYDISEDYVERIIFRNDLQAWEKVLSECLGPAVKRAGEETTQDNLMLTIDYGGIQDDQILFHKKFDGRSVIAMIWPWKDNNQMTLKIACFKEEGRSRNRPYGG